MTKRLCSVRGVLATYSREHGDVGFTGPPHCVVFGQR
jgi:hypothetical protein